MNLEEFIKVSLEQIVSGVSRAQDNTKIDSKNPAKANLINPKVMNNADSAPKGKYFTTQERNLVHFVDFDVAVSAENQIGGEGGFKLSVAGITDVKMGGSGSSSESVVSRIKFQVPIQFPNINT